MEYASDVANGGQEETTVVPLPTLQHNALCKFFDRSNYTPTEVVALGYQRLQKIGGIGPKGLDIIIAWARCYGLELKTNSGEKMERQAQRVERAICFLKAHGYKVSRVEKESKQKPSTRQIQKNAGGGGGLYPKDISNKVFIIFLFVVLRINSSYHSFQRSAAPCFQTDCPGLSGVA
jgi:hypothetical protein